MAGALIPMPGLAQHFRMRDGRTLAAQAVIVRGNQLVRALEVQDGGAAEVGFPLSEVASLDWPEPEELIRARENFARNALAAALADAEAVALRFAPFAILPGSWWGEAELLRLRALAALDRWDGIESAARQLSERAPAVRVRQAAQILVAMAHLRERRLPEAKAIVDSLDRPGLPPGDAAAIAVLRGNLRLQESDWEGALEAFLGIPAFYPTQTRLMPPALLGSARAYRKLGDLGRAERSLLELVEHYPESAEARQASTVDPGL